MYILFMYVLHICILIFVYTYVYTYIHIHVEYTGQQQAQTGVRLWGLLGRSMSYHQASIYFSSWLV